jgi:hypothetical protein
VTLAGAIRTAIELADREHVLIRAAEGYAAGVLLPDKLGALTAVSRALSDAGVPFALIGGLAVGVRSGVPRATLDVDLAVPSNANHDIMIRALVAAGLSHAGTFAHSMNFSHSSGEPVQLAFDPAFDPMIARAEAMLLGDVSVPVVTKLDLLAMKRRAAADPARRRSKALRDLADIALLEGDVPEPQEGW